MIVKDGSKINFEVIEKLSYSAYFWSAIPKKNEKFEETVCQLKIPHTKKLAKL